ncbi:MAG: LysR family transcriptional regulator [Rhodobacteraceae bacterium]|nr:LysR family transcriptional regulator [Paracoccaceae bacterium]
MRITLRQLEYFLATGETGSIRLASERVRIAPSAISAAIARLETDLGVALFRREQAQSLALTATGRALLAEARAILDRVAELPARARAIDGAGRRRLAVGFFVVLAPMLMPEVTRGFAARHPGLGIDPCECDQAELLDGMRQGTIEVAMTYDLGLAEGIAFEPLATLPAHVIVAADHPLAARPSLGLPELAREPMILLDLPLSRDYFMALFQGQGLEPRVALRTRSPEHLRGLVANGFGYAIANARPRTLAALDGRGLARIPLEGPCRSLRVGLATPAGMPQRDELAAFAAFCRELFAPPAIPGMDLADPLRVAAPAARLLRIASPGGHGPG